MTKRYIGIVIAVIVLVSIWFMIKESQDRYFPEMSYDILNYEEVPEFVKDEINNELLPRKSNATIEIGDGSYIVLIPPENESVEILSVEKNINSFNGVIYRYRYTDKVSDNVMDNIKIIKVSNFDGSITGSFTSN